MYVCDILGDYLLWKFPWTRILSDAKWNGRTLNNLILVTVSTELQYRNIRACHKTVWMLSVVLMFSDAVRGWLFFTGNKAGHNRQLNERSDFIFGIWVPQLYGNFAYNSSLQGLWKLLNKVIILVLLKIMYGTEAVKLLVPYMTQLEKPLI